MAPITDALVQQLRDWTGESLIVCKGVLEETNGDVDQAFVKLREADASFGKRQQVVAAAGLIAVRNNAEFGSILEVNCQTDFVALDPKFEEFVNKVAAAAFEGRITDVKELNKKFDEDCTRLTAMLGEKIVIQRVAGLKGKQISSYVHNETPGYSHNGRIGVLMETSGHSRDLTGKIGMHITAMNPKTVKARDVPGLEGTDVGVLSFLRWEVGEQQEGTESLKPDLLSEIKNLTKE